MLGILLTLIYKEGTVFGYFSAWDEMCFLSEMCRPTYIFCGRMSD